MAIALIEERRFRFTSIQRLGRVQLRRWKKFAYPPGFRELSAARVRSEVECAQIRHKAAFMRLEGCHNLDTVSLGDPGWQFMPLR